MIEKLSTQEIAFLQSLGIWEDVKQNINNPEVLVTIFANAELPLEEMYFSHRNTFFGPEAKRRILLGSFASSADSYDAVYGKAQKVRELAKQDFDKVFAQVDLLLTPTTPEFPFKIGSKTTDPIKMYLSDVMTCGINPVRIPALNVNLGLSLFEGKMLPAGCQIMGPELSEDDIFNFALQIEKLTK